MSRASDFELPHFNSYKTFQSCLLSWFYYLLKFPAQSSLGNSRLIGILYCFCDNAIWMSKRHFNLFKSKIEFLVSPYKLALLSSFPFLINHNCTNTAVRQKKKKSQNYSWHPLFSYIKSIRESCGFYLQNISRILLNFFQLPYSNNSMAGATNISSLRYWNSLLINLSLSTLDSRESLNIAIICVHLKCNSDHITTLLKTMQWFPLHNSQTQRAPISPTWFPSVRAFDQVFW